MCALNGHMADVVITVRRVLSSYHQALKLGGNQCIIPDPCNARPYMWQSVQLNPTSNFAQMTHRVPSPPSRNPQACAAASTHSHVYAH